MRCPSCGHATNKVIDSRVSRDEEEIRRRRECLECSRRFTTRERAEESLPRIVKRDERREDYDRRKLLLGIKCACTKRSVNTDAIERMVERIEKRLQEAGDREVTSAVLGQAVLGELALIDGVSAARFASVFLEFQGPADYEAFFESLPPSARPPRGPGGEA